MNYAIQRDRMVRRLQSRGITDPRVLDAMRGVARHRFVEEALQGKAYDDDVALPIGDQQTISQPWIVARMTELLEPDGGGRALEIGSGSGYQAAVLSRLYHQVYSVERIPEFSRRALRIIRALGIENAHFKIFDGGYGWSEFAPYRGILVTAAAPELPAPLLEQLADGGRLVLPLASRDDPDDQVLARVTRRGDGVERETFGACKFVPLLGRFGWPT